MSETIDVPRPHLTEEDLPDGFLFTPGGDHIFTMTPGGTRLQYDRESIRYLSKSPISMTPPRNMTSFPGITRKSNLDYYPPTTQHSTGTKEKTQHTKEPQKITGEKIHEEDHEDMMFEMDV